MIAVTEYSMEERYERDILYHRGMPVGATVLREPTATIRLEVIASGADLDKFMTMLETITGQRHPRPAPTENAPVFGSAAIVEP